MRSICRNRKPCSPLYLLFILLAGPSAIAQQARPPWEEARAAQIEAARREGIPLTQADLQGASIPADRNAATYLAKIRELDKNSPVSPLEAAALEDVKKADPTPEQIALGRKALEAHRERSRLLRLAAECPSYSEAIPPLDVDGIVMPDTFVRDAQFREYARWLVAESMVLLYEGKPLAAVQTDALVFGLARQVASPGSIISLLVSEAVDSIALGGIRVVLYHDGEDVTVAEAVVQAIDRRRGAPNLGLALRGEVVMMLAMSDSQRRQMPAMPHFKPGDLSVPPFENTAAFRAVVKKYHYPADPKRALARFLDMNDAHYLAWIRRILALVDLPYPEALRGIQAITREVETSEKHPDYSLAATSISSCLLLPVTKARHEAVAQTVRTAAALLAWQAWHGQFPETLAQCLTPTPLDPFDLQMLGYRKEGAGFVLYSVGKTGKFDGGQPGKKPRSGETLFRYPRPVYTHKGHDKGTVAFRRHGELSSCCETRSQARLCNPPL